MTYASLHECIQDLAAHNMLAVVDHEVDARLEAALIQRLAYRKGGPALLFPRVKGCSFPMLANLFGTMGRTRFIFRKSLPGVEALLRLKADPHELLRKPWRYAALPKVLWNMLPKKVSSGPATECAASLSALPQLVSWPKDGGAYVTLPQVYTEQPGRPGFFSSNLGMYRVQISGGGYEKDKEAGLHYQIHRGIGPHHLAALEQGADLPVSVFIGGPPAMTLAAVMPLPEGMPEVTFAGALAGRRIPFMQGPNGLPLPAEADFCLCGYLPGKGGKAQTKPEGPFGDHLGYYSLEHDFPAMRVTSVFHRKNAVWPFTSVGRPPQEDTVFGDFIHELTGALVPSVFSGVHEVHAVDAAGVHPLLLALGSERYVPFAEDRIPQELLTCALSLLGTTQTSLSKYLFIAAKEDAPHLSCRDIPGFFRFMLERIDLRRDLHFITRTTMDTLDYSGISLNQGSKAVFAAAGKPRRRLAKKLSCDFALPEGFTDARLFAPGIVVCKGPKHTAPRDTHDPLMQEMEKFCAARPPHGKTDEEGEVVLLVVTDDVGFAAASWDNWLWVAFTRSDPATDLYGAGAEVRCKHWGCKAPLIMDARMKSFHAPALEDDPDVLQRVLELGAAGGPLHGFI